MTNFEYLHDVQKRSGLSIREFVDLLPIDRTTWYSWAKGIGAETLHMRLSVARAQKIEKLIDRGQLPFIEAVAKKHRVSSVLMMLQGK